MFLFKINKTYSYINFKIPNILENICLFTGGLKKTFKIALY